MLSNAVHIILLGNIDMKIPALIMLRRTQELILTFIFYSEHPVELFKKRWMIIQGLLVVLMN